MDNHTKNLSPNTSMSLSFKKTINGNKDKLVLIWGDIFIASCLYVAIVLSLLSMFNIHLVSIFILVPGLVLIVLMNYFIKKGSMHIRYIVMLSVILIAVLFIFQKYMVNGLFLTMNQVAETVGVHTGYSMKKYAVLINSEQYGVAIGLFICVSSLIIAYFSTITVNNGSRLFIWLCILPILLFQLVFGINPAIYYNFLLVFTGILLASYSFIIGANRDTLIGKTKNSIIFLGAVIMLLLFVSTFLLLQFIRPMSSYTKQPYLIHLKESLVDGVEAFRYEKDKTNSFTQGDFRRLGDLQLLDKPALKIVMNQPTSLYLKGYVGSTYTHDRWSDLDDKVYYESYSLFYWLNQLGFDGLNQLNNVYELVSKSANDTDKLDITINNINANSKYLYVPYELKTNPDTISNVKTRDDSVIISKSFFGDRLYSYQSSENLVKQYPKLANDLYTIKNKKKDETYFNNESHYNQYIYENYLAIPKDTKLLIQSHLKESAKAERTSYEETINFVKGYVNETIKYNMQAKSVPKEQDFMQFLLEDSREGYATHYATLATLLFRYFEIPSRYVEGYIITPNVVKNMEPFEEITLKGTNAHAWTEIYLDEIGWIPIEVTPPYYETMEKTDLSHYPVGNLKQNNSNAPANSQNTNSNKASSKVQNDKKEHKNTTNKNPKEKLTIYQALFLFVSIVLTLFVLTILIYIVNKRREVKRRISSFQEADYRIAIPSIFEYTIALLHYSGVPKRSGAMLSYIDDLEKLYSTEFVEKFRDAVAINQEALYSKHTISEEKFIRMYAFMKETQTKLLQSKNIFQKIKMKFWDYIY